MVRLLDICLCSVSGETLTVHRGHWLHTECPLIYAYGLVFFDFVVIILFFIGFVDHLCMYFRIASLSLGQLYDCPSTNEVSMEHMRYILSP